LRDGYLEYSSKPPGFGSGFKSKTGAQAWLTFTFFGLKKAIAQAEGAKSD
jgi:hypothetical protein